MAPRSKETAAGKRPRRPLAERLKEYTFDELAEAAATAEATLELVTTECGRRQEALDKIAGSGRKKTITPVAAKRHVPTVDDVEEETTTA